MTTDRIDIDGWMIAAGLLIANLSGSVPERISQSAFGARAGLAESR